jgi:23S rRNA (adenine2503-C2)-methyltransferase
MSGPMTAQPPSLVVPEALITRARPGTRDRRPGISGLAPASLGAWLRERAAPAYRAQQIWGYVWTGSAASFAAMRTLPAGLRLELETSFRADTLVETAVRPADEGLTEKGLHRLDDGTLVESVLMRYPARGGRRERNTVCISSQAGCAVGCPFCATGELGFGRDLEAAEIVDQVRYWQRRLGPTGGRVTNVVFMGMGEPLLNADRVFAAAAALTDPARFGLGARHLTISTSGVVPGILALTALRPRYTLAISLHAARAALRDVLVPINRRYPVDQVVQAASAYAETTGRRVSYEVVMIAGINDTDFDAAEMARLLRGRLAHVNLMPMNPVAHTPWQPSSPERLTAFTVALEAAGIATTVRRNRGTEIGAACGQLAAEQAGAPSPAAVARRRERLERESAAAVAGSGA